MRAPDSSHLQAKALASKAFSNTLVVSRYEAVRKHGSQSTALNHCL